MPKILRARAFSSSADRSARRAPPDKRPAGRRTPRRSAASRAAPPRSPTPISRRLSSRSRQNTSNNCCPIVRPEDRGPGACSPPRRRKHQHQMQDDQLEPAVDRVRYPVTRVKHAPSAPAPRSCHREHGCYGCGDRAETRAKIIEIAHFLKAKSRSQFLANCHAGFGGTAGGAGTQGGMPECGASGGCRGERQSAGGLCARFRAGAAARRLPSAKPSSAAMCCPKARSSKFASAHRRSRC